jgi:hypothetical protein
MQKLLRAPRYYDEVGATAHRFLAACGSCR